MTGHRASSTPPNRCIRLRRPPVLAVAPEPFVPAGVAPAAVDARWRELCERNPAYFDGRILHVFGVHRNGHGSATIHCVECAYRYYAVCDETLDTGVRPLGVKAFTLGDRGVLVGRRAAHVGGYAGCWEFAPGGGLEPGAAPESMVTSELREETGLEPASAPVPLGVLLDPVMRTWEIVYRIRVEPGAMERPTREYPELRWLPLEAVSRDGLPEPTSPIARTMRGLVEWIA